MASEMTWIAVAVVVGLIVLVFYFVVGRLVGWPGSASAPKSPRRSPFKVGRSYRVLRAFQSRDAFPAGEILVYKSEGYSIYDGATAYFFETMSDQQSRTWAVRDDEDLEVWRTLFEEVLPISAPHAQR